MCQSCQIVGLQWSQGYLYLGLHTSFPPLVSLPLVLSSLKWKLIAVSTRSQITSSIWSLYLLFGEMFANAYKRHLGPWGVLIVKNSMLTKKCVNTIKPTQTQLQVALIKNVYPVTKPIDWDFNKPMVPLFSFLVCASICVCFVYSVMACSYKMPFCINWKFPRQMATIQADLQTATCKNLLIEDTQLSDFWQVWLKGKKTPILLTQTIVFL